MSQPSSLKLNLLTAVAAIVLALGVGQLFAGPGAVGVTTDEPTHVDRMTTWIEDGWYLPSRNIVDGEPDPNDPLATPYVYGPAFSVAAHAINVVLGNEALDEISSSASAHAVRHLTVALLALLAVAAVGAAVWHLTRSWRFGIWAAAGLLAVPPWMGHAFFNIKDVPTAVGYTLVTVGLVFALLEGFGKLTGRRREALITVLLAVGVCVGVGTRLSVWVPFLASFATYGALRLGQWKLGAIGGRRGADLAVAIGGLGGLAVIAALYPNVARTPVELFVNPISDSAGYPNDAVTLTAGELLSENPPLWYLPTWIAASYPLLLGALAFAGGVLWLRGLARRESAAPWLRAVWSRPELALLLVFQQAAMIPLAAMTTDAVMYDGLRQHLYVVPPIAIFAGIGAAGVWKWTRSRKGSAGWPASVAVAVMSVALIVPMAEQTILFPYNYAYVNPVAGAGGVTGRWEADYWFGSAPEALERVPREADLLCADAVAPPEDPDAELTLLPCGGGGYFEPYGDRRGADVSNSLQDVAGLWVIGRKRAGRVAPTYCEQVDNVTRWLRGETVTMSYVMRCPSEPAPPDG